MFLQNEILKEVIYNSFDRSTFDLNLETNVAPHVDYPYKDEHYVNEHAVLGNVVFYESHRNGPLDTHSCA